MWSVYGVVSPISNPGAPGLPAASRYWRSKFFTVSPPGGARGRGAPLFSPLLRGENGNGIWYWLWLWLWYWLHRIVTVTVLRTVHGLSIGQSVGRLLFRVLRGDKDELRVSFDEVPPPHRFQLCDDAERPSREARASDKQVQWEAGHDPHTLNNGGAVRCVDSPHPAAGGIVPCETHLVGGPAQDNAGKAVVHIGNGNADVVHAVLLSDHSSPAEFARL